MSPSFYIAQRYLFSKKSVGIIALISGISVCGVALATLAMVCTLSVFNGFTDLVASFFTTFDPQLKITAVSGKSFDGADPRLAAVRERGDVAVYSETLEEQAMVQYHDRQAMVTLKGVTDNFQQLTEIDSILVGMGQFKLADDLVDYGVMGINLVGILGTGIAPQEPLQVFVPTREGSINMANPPSSFTQDYLYSPGVVFRVNQQEYDAHYILTPLPYLRRLLQYETEVSAVELKLCEGCSVRKAKREIREMLGGDFAVEDRYEQQADVFRIMEIEKLVSYGFLTFILAIACFNIIGSLSMLMIDKKRDVETLRTMGANDRLIIRIFLMEGRLIALLGAGIGIVGGVALCLAQQHFGLLSLGAAGDNFVVEAYPVRVQWGDILLVLLTVTVTSWVAVWFPVRTMARRIVA